MYVKDARSRVVKNYLKALKPVLIAVKMQGKTLVRIVKNTEKKSTVKSVKSIHQTEQSIVIMLE